MHKKIPSSIQRNRSLAELTTFGIGGTCSFFAEAESPTTLKELYQFSLEQNIPVYPIGFGSNLIASHRGYPGLVVRYTDKTCRVISGEAESNNICNRLADHRVILYVGAGMDWDALVAHTVKEGLAGLECLSGIPGLVGSSPIQNIGAYGQEVANHILRVHLFDNHSFKNLTIDKRDCGFGYRHSFFKSTTPPSALSAPFYPSSPFSSPSLSSSPSSSLSPSLSFSLSPSLSPSLSSSGRGRYTITGVEFSLLKNGKPEIIYPELAKRFSSHSSPTLSEVRNTVLNIRREKSMLYDREDPNHRSAGSFFTNPVLSRKTAGEVIARVPDGLYCPQYEVDSEHVKLSAAWLIQNSGFEKGHSFGEVSLSSKHVLALINRGQAVSNDVLSACQTIQQTVFSEFGVRLTPEPNFLGFFQDELAPLYWKSVQ